MAVPEIFDRRLRRIRRDRAAARFDEQAFLVDHIAEGILDRLDGVRREFSRVLSVGWCGGRLSVALQARGMEVVCVDAGSRFSSRSNGIQCDEDALPFDPASFDLVVSAGVLDQVNDLPGALVQIRRILRPDGLFLGGFPGAGSLPRLRGALMAADMALGGAVAPRMHPMIDVRAAGDLLSRAGFALPVADGEPLIVRYGDPMRLITDLRAMAMTNLLKDQQRGSFGKGRLAAMLEALAADNDPDGKLAERFELIFMTGWAPGPDQPQPAKRGSGTQSLASVFRRAQPSG